MSEYYYIYSPRRRKYFGYRNVGGRWGPWCKAHPMSALGAKRFFRAFSKKIRSDGIAVEVMWNSDCDMCRVAEDK